MSPQRPHGHTGDSTPKWSPQVVCRNKYRGRRREETRWRPKRAGARALQLLGAYAVRPTPTVHPSPRTASSGPHLVAVAIAAGLPPQCTRGWGAPPYALCMHAEWRKQGGHMPAVCKPPPVATHAPPHVRSISGAWAPRQRCPWVNTNDDGRCCSGSCRCCCCCARAVSTAGGYALYWGWARAPASRRRCAPGPVMRAVPPAAGECHVCPRLSHGASVATACGSGGSNRPQPRGARLSRVSGADAFERCKSPSQVRYRQLG